MANSIVHESEADTVSVPVLGPRGHEAPEKDPYLLEGTETTETVTVCGYELPPIREGVHRGLGLRGQPQDYNVRVVWVSRRQIDAMLQAIGQQHPELDQALEVVSTFIMHLDTIRDETGLGIAAALSVLRKEKDKHPHALENLETVSWSSFFRHSDRGSSFKLSELQTPDASRSYWVTGIPAWSAA